MSVHPSIPFARPVWTVLLALLAPVASALQLGLPDGPKSDVPIALFEATPSQGEAPLDVRFQSQSLGRVSGWLWDFGDGGTSTLASPVHRYREGGAFSVTLTVSGSAGSDTLAKPAAVVVTSCSISNARENRAYPLKLGMEYVPVTGDDALGFYCVYSGKAVAPDNPSVANNVGLYLFPLTNGEVLLFGAGYGDPNNFVEPTQDAAFDVRRIDSILRFCLGRVPSATPIRFVAPHGHIDHINADCMRELRRAGYPIAEIAYHSADGNQIKNLPGWTTADRNIFHALRGNTGLCQEELLSFDSPLGKIWFHLRDGHTNGSIDLVIDVRGERSNRFLVLGSGGIYGSCPLPGVREVVGPHGNVVLSAPPPTVSSASPVSGSAMGGTTVALFGESLAAPDAGIPLVTFDGAPASAVTVLDDLTLTCVAPAGLPGKSASIAIVNRNGSATLAGAYTFHPLPRLSSVSPDHGAPSGGTRITVRGSGFLALNAGDNVLTFAGAPATAVQVLDDATLQCTTPSGVPGAADVLVANGNGFSELAGGFHYEALLEALTVTPSWGSSRGGLRVAVQGTGFSGGSSTPEVSFGSTPALDIVRVSDTLLTCTTPPGPVGTWVDVVVSGENGNDVLDDAFRYVVAPLVTSVAPASGPEGGVTVVTVRGANFTRNSAGPLIVTFGGAPATAVSALSDSSLRCTVPRGTAGSSVPVEVSNLNGSGSLDAGYRYHRRPALTSIQPGQGEPAGGMLLTVSGSGFLETGAGTTTLRLGGVAATELTVQDDATLLCRAPAGTAGTSVAAEVENANGRVTLDRAFRYATPPTLGAVDPASGSSGGGTLVTLRGSGFLAAGAGAARVSFGFAPAEQVRVLDDSTLTCRTPVGDAGTAVDLVLENDNGAARLPRAFTYLAQPTIASVVPAEGPTAGGTLVRLTGSGFLQGSLKVYFGTIEGTGLRVLGDTLLECSTPPSPAGAVSVNLTTQAGVAVLFQGFVFGTPRPTVAGLDPDHGPSAGGNPIEIRGSGFTSSAAGATGVAFGSTLASAVTALNDGLLSCVPPPGAPGTAVDVSVFNANGTDSVLAAYRYHLRPSLSSLTPADGSPLGGTLVTLSGRGFLVDGAGTNLVRFAGVRATEVRVLADDLLTCRAPPSTGSGPVDVELTNTNGQARLVQAYRYYAAPTLAGLAPAAGTGLGGTSVTLTGTGLALDGAAATSVLFAGVAASDVVVVNDTTVTCKTPAGSAGISAAVRLTNSNGSVELAGAFAYHPAPLITSFTPGNASAIGGATVTVNGSGFRTSVVGANTVTFGGIPARSVTTVDDVRLRAVVPTGPAGQTVDLVVRNSNGSVTRSPGLRYNATPVLAVLAPPSGTALGGTTVTLTGSGFQRDAAGTNRVLFGTVPATLVTLVDDTTLSCLVPPGTAGGTVAVSVANNNGATTTQAFAYHPAPLVTELVPPFGYSGGSTLVELHGSGFLANSPGGNQVLFGTSAASEVVVVDDATLRCRTPAHAPGPVVVQLSNENGAISLADGFYYDWAPTVVTLQPAAGSSLGGTEVRLTGGGFATSGAGPLAVRFGAGSATNIRVVDGGTLLCDAPPGTPGASVSVVVSNGHGSSSVAGYRYHDNPTLTSIDPTQGLPEGGTLATLRGTGFLANAAGACLVTFAGRPATAVSVVDDSTLRCRVPAGPARTRATITLSNANGAASLFEGFRWFRPDPSDLNGDGIGDALLGAEEAAFVFFGSDSSLGDESTAVADVTLKPSTASGDFGAQVAFGDLNGDTFSDAIVGAPLDNTAASDAGAVFVFFGPLAPSAVARTASSASATFLGLATGDHFGASLVVADVTGDGRADLVVGAPNNDTSSTGAGAVYVFRGAASFTSQATSAAAVRLLGAGSQYAFGSALAAGDVTGDGVLDLVVGAPDQGSNGSDSGSAYVFRGGTALVSASSSAALIQIDGSSSNDRLGFSVAAGDVDGDRIDDLFMGAPDARANGSTSGSVFYFRGGATLVSGEATDAKAKLYGEAPGDHLGKALALGDADGDGKADLLLGAPENDVPASNAGRAYLVRGSAMVSGTISQVATMVMMGENSSADQFGASLSFADLDGDGRADALVGAPYSNGGAGDSGRVFVFLGAGIQASRSAVADDVTYTGNKSGLMLGKDLGNAR